MKAPSPFEHSPDRNAKRLADARLIASALFGRIGVPRSVVDIGGGQGAWGIAFQGAGVASYLCIDHPDSADGLTIDERSFVACDLAKSMPPQLTADLAVCLEVAEHLPAAVSDDLVKWLTNAAPVVLFSAAVPGQPGDRHINCQPPSYWRELFERSGFTRFDPLRPTLRRFASMPYWFKQNLFVFANSIDTAIVDRLGPPAQDDDLELVSQRVLQRYRAGAEQLTAITSTRLGRLALRLAERRRRSPRL